jgi:hypothetical protein
MQQLTERQAAERAQIDGRLEGIQFQRTELQSQLQQLRRRRNELDEQRQVAPQAQRGAIAAQIAEIDARSTRLDQQIQSLNDQFAEGLAQKTALAGGPSARQAPGVIRIPEISIPPIDLGGRRRNTDMQQIGGIMAAEAVVLALIGVFAWRMGMRRMREQFERMLGAQSQQLGQLQNAVDVIGIEVERISEGQRYVAKVLSEGNPASALPVARKDQQR